MNRSNIENPAIPFSFEKKITEGALRNLLILFVNLISKLSLYGKDNLATQLQCWK